MHKTVIKTIVSLAMCAAYSQAGAWTAVAHSSDNGATFTQHNTSSAIEANQKALEGCSKMGMNCVLVGDAEAGPGAMIIAKGDNGMSRVFNRDIDKGVQDVKQLCAKKYKNCRVVSATWDKGPTWASVALGDDAFYVTYNASSQEKAAQDAIKQCEHKVSKTGSCKTVRLFDDTGWIAIAKSKSYFGISANISRDAALKEAKGECAKSTAQGDACSKIEEVKNIGLEEEPAAFKKLLAQIEPKKKTEAVRYTESCNNADCTRKFSDGRLVRYTACVNPATLLPMNDPVKLGGCSGTDSRGNLFGMKSM